MKKLFVLAHPDARKRAVQYTVEAPDGHVVTISEPTRNLTQNALLWSTLSEVAKQVTWHGRKLDAESWKHIFTSSLKRQDVVPNLDGTGFVVMGVSTSKMSKAQFSELIELIFCFGAQHGVTFNDQREVASHVR